jgi:serine/threonine protein kinase
MKEQEEDLIDKFTGQLYDQYEVIDVVGSGTFGKVYLVLHAYIIGSIKCHQITIRHEACPPE